MQHKLLADVLLQRIDDLHCGPDARYTISCFTDAGTTEGRYVLTPYPGEPRIYLGKKARFPNLTLAHELGHHITAYFLRVSTAGIATDPRLADWRAAVESTMPYQYLNIAARKGLLFRKLEDGTLEKITASNTDRLHVQYLRTWPELWARSYAQYVALQRCSGPVYAEWCNLHNSDLNFTYQYTWEVTDTEFIPIGRAISELLHSQGWLHHEQN